MCSQARNRLYNGRTQSVASSRIYLAVARQCYCKTGAVNSSPTVIIQRRRSRVVDCRYPAPPAWSSETQLHSDTPPPHLLVLSYAAVVPCRSSAKTNLFSTTSESCVLVLFESTPIAVLYGPVMSKLTCVVVQGGAVAHLARLRRKAVEQPSF